MALRPLYEEFWDWLWSNYPKRPWLQPVPEDHWVMKIRKYRVLMSIPAAFMLCLFLGYYLLVTYWPLCLLFTVLLVLMLVALVYYLDRRRRAYSYNPPLPISGPYQQEPSRPSTYISTPRKSAGLDPKCPYCGTVVGPRAVSCWSCGKLFDDWCPECLSPYPKGTMKCAQCSELVK
jgi:hypothetical protein